MKTYNIEVQKVKAMANGHGLIHARIDALVQPQQARRGADEDDNVEPHTMLSMSEDTARVLLLLLKTQLSEFDKRKAKSRF